MTHETALSDLNPHEWQIICDFDGTITPSDVTDAVLKNFAPPAWETVEADWLCGKITARQCMEQQVAMLETPIHLLDAFLDTIPLTDGFSAFIQFCRSRALQVLIVSDGMDYAIRRILTNYGLQELPVVANRLRYHGHARYQLEFPYGIDGCTSGVCKCAVANTWSGKTLLIGDGHSDCCLSGQVSFILAKTGKALQQHCLDEGYPHHLYNNFFDILDLLSSHHTTGGQLEDCTNR